VSLDFTDCPAISPRSLMSVARYSETGDCPETNVLRSVITPCCQMTARHVTPPLAHDGGRNTRGSTLLRARDLRMLRTWVDDARDEYGATLPQLSKTIAKRSAKEREHDFRFLERARYEGSFAPKTAVRLAEMILNCPSTIAYRQRIGHDTIQEQWQRVLRTRIAPTEDDRALNAPAIIPAEAQESLALLVCEAIKRKGLLIGPAAKAAVVVERVLHNQAPIMAFYGGASLHQDLPDRKPSALDFAGLCSDLARP
jgi:hypothetical protein